MRTEGAWEPRERDPANEYKAKFLSRTPKAAERQTNLHGEGFSRRGQAISEDTAVLAVQQAWRMEESKKDRKSKDRERETRQTFDNRFGYHCEQLSLFLFAENAFESEARHLRLERETQTGSNENATRQNKKHTVLPLLLVMATLFASWLTSIDSL
jgi:hypothetical protein